jgi:ketosteroid isomerase-like protein
MTEGDREEFAALLKAWSTGIVVDDADAIGRFVEPEWVLVGETGIHSREQFLEAVASGNLTHETMYHEVHRVRIYGDVAVATLRVTNNGTYKGTPLEADEWSTDVFVLSGGAWRCVLTHLTPASPPSGQPLSADEREDLVTDLRD